MGNSALRYNLYLILAFFIISIIVLTTVKIWGKKFLKHLIIIFIPITIILTFYFLNYDFNLFIKSSFFSNHNSIVYYKDNKKLSIPLPANSVFLFKTPTLIYYSKCDINKCKYFFDSELNNMKQNKQISNYHYDISNKNYIIEVEGEANVEIHLIGDNDGRRYGISILSY